MKILFKLFEQQTGKIKSMLTCLSEYLEIILSWKKFSIITSPNMFTNCICVFMHASSCGVFKKISFLPSM